MNIHREQTHSQPCGGFKSPWMEIIVAALRDGRSSADQDSADASQPQLRPAEQAALERLGDAPGRDIAARLKELEAARRNRTRGGQLTEPCPREGVETDATAVAFETLSNVRDDAASTRLYSPPANGLYESQTSFVTLGDVEPDESHHAVICREYQQIIKQQRLSDAQDYPLRELLGAGGQGKVYLSERCGADDFRQPLAIKVFSPEKYLSARSYVTAMTRLSRVGSQLSWPQHGNVVGIQGFEQRGQIRIMLMELVEGYDLCQLLDPKLPEELRASLSAEHWDEVCKVVMVPAPEGPRLQPGVAFSIIRDCLSGLHSLHRRGLVHGDIKMANIMVQRSGRAKIIDLGSAYHGQFPPRTLVFTPAYAAPETLEGCKQTRRSDLASLGYVLVELLAGQRIFAGITDVDDLLQAKHDLSNRLEELIPAGVRDCKMLMEFCRRLIAPEPDKRWPNAERADIDPECGAARFLDQLVLGNLASIYESEIRTWLRPLPSRNL
jgi:eukaryotic-like serine/threonine-protein kinase